METRTRYSTDCRNIKVEYHVLDQVCIIKVLMLETLCRQFGICFPTVRVRFCHPAVTDMSEDDDFVLEVKRKNSY